MRFKNKIDRAYIASRSTFLYLSSNAMKYLPDVLGLLGLLILTYGLWLISLPLSLIVLGILLILAGYRIQSNAITGNNGSSRPPP